LNFKRAKNAEESRMNIDMSQFFQVFFDETDELLAEKERLLLAIDLEAPDMEDIDAIFRAAHSIKGGAATFGLKDMTEVTHILETLLDMIRKKELKMTAEHVDAFLVAKDVLVMQRDGHRHGAPVDKEAVADVMARLQSLSQEATQQKSAPGSSAPAGTSAPGIQSKPVPNAARSIRIELPDVSQKDADALAVELALLGALESVRLENGHQAFLLATSESMDDILAICSFVLDPDDLIISEETAASGQKQDEAQPVTSEVATSDSDFGIFQPGAEGNGLAPKAADEAPVVSSSSGATGVSPAQAAPKPAPKQQAERAPVNQESSSIRVGVEKVDQLINLVGELVITQAMIEQRSSMLDPMVYERLLGSVNQLTRNTRDLQEAVMSIRMMPMDYVFSRFPRMVRDLAGKLGKKVDFVTHGAATELDKGLIERIIDPLTHLVRNSVDHGVEMPDVRVASGKSETGRLSLSAAHQGGNIVIEVIDDGGGLNRERILAKAMQSGLPVSESMPDNEVWQLIFAPGFSTAELVTDVSGRGVGMDVVKRNITAMGGVVDIRSAKSRGTTISISLPLTLAILDGMSIKVGDEIYILPLGYVIESLKPVMSDIKEIAGQGRVIKVRGEYLPLVPLYQVFNIEPRYIEPSDGIVVILESDGTKAALFIDEMLGQQQVVVKNLESNYRKVHGISGATILGDGGVALILDVAAVIRSIRQ
jgi:two-component system, chemotaxis family, sensor kinase CheA